MNTNNIKARRETLIKKLTFHHENGMSWDNQKDAIKLNQWQEELTELDRIIYLPQRKEGK